MDFEESSAGEERFYSTPDIDLIENYDIVFDEILIHLEHILNSDIRLKPIQIALIGNRILGNYKSNTDIEIIIECESELSETEIADILNAEPLFFDHAKIDYIPLRVGRYGPEISPIDKWLEYHQEYNDVDIKKMSLNT